MMKTISAALLVLFLVGPPVAGAEDLIAYAGFNVNRASINVDSFGATSMEKEVTRYKIFAAYRLYEYLYVEYGYQDLGEYKAEYDFTVGTFRFVESHRLDFSQTFFLSLMARASVSEILALPVKPPFWSNLYFHVNFGALLWQAELQMDGLMYDAGTLYSTYGATGDDSGFSAYYGFGLGYRFSEEFMLTLTREIFLDVGKGVTLRQLDGSEKEYAGRNVKTIGLSFSYLF